MVAPSGRPAGVKQSDAVQRAAGSNGCGALYVDAGTLDIRLEASWRQSGFGQRGGVTLGQNIRSRCRSFLPASRRKTTPSSAWNSSRKA